MRAPFAVPFLCALAVACHTTSGSPVLAVTPATAAERAALIDRVKALAGTWETTMGGKTQTASVFSVSSNGSAVREVMFPGGADEMTNMYTMDGGSLVLTHYCAGGNQPRMRARAGGANEPIRFESAGVSNLEAADAEYMGGLMLTFQSADRVRAEWIHHRAGQPFGENTVIELTRKR